MSDKKWDVFISHASEDKDTIVRQLAFLLAKIGVRVWYDEFSLKIGDSLTQKIDEGLIQSNFGIIIISKHFLNKKWTDYEYRSLLGKEDHFKKRILPIWHGVTRDDVKSFSLYLSDKFALDTNKSSTQQIVKNILQVIRPDIYENLMRVILFNEKLSKAKIKEIEISEIKWGEKQRDRLTKQQINRIKGIFYSLGSYLDMNIEDTLDCYLYDYNPNREIQVWEAINASFLEFIKKENIKDNRVKRDVFIILFGFSLGKLPQYTTLSDEKIISLLETWKENYPFEVPSTPQKEL